MSKSILGKLEKIAGTYSGEGINHENQKFYATLKLLPAFPGKALTIDFAAKGVNGEDFHKEHSILGLNASEELSLWASSSNHPGVMEHCLLEKNLTTSTTLTFRYVDPKQNSEINNPNLFREEICMDLHPDGDLSYRYFWAMPGQELQERSTVRMSYLKQTPIPQAKLITTEHGLVPEGDGWYVLNAKDSRWYRNEKFGDTCNFEGKQRFEQYGINIHVIQPGQPNCHYHGEDDQEDFLVLQGECTLLIEGEERQLKPWDFVHCPKWARHVFVGSGKEPCTIIMVGGRTGHGVIYPVNELTKKYSAGPMQETDSPKESYKNSPKSVDSKNLLPRIFEGK